MTDLKAFEEWLLDNNRAEKTIRNTLGDIRRILRDGPVESRDDLRSWIRKRRLDGMQNVTLNHYLRSINLFCVMKQWEKFPYAREYKPMKIKTIAGEEIDAIKKGFSGYTKERDMAIFALELGCGLRIQEIWNLQLQDIREETVIVRGKGQKIREVYLPPEVRSILRKYMEHRPPSDPNYLFVTPAGRMKYEYIRQVIPRIAERSGIRMSNHMARHTYATALLENGVDIYSIKDILGHSDVKTTTVYIHADQSRAIREVKSKMPKFFLYITH